MEVGKNIWENCACFKWGKDFRKWKDKGLSNNKMGQNNQKDITLE